MALNIKDPETERLAGEIANLTGESKTGAIRTALRERRQRLELAGAVVDRAAAIRKPSDELWAQLPAKSRGKPMSREDQDEILGYGPDGV
jgi:antitoxin VapB